MPVVPVEAKPEGILLKVLAKTPEERATWLAQQIAGKSWCQGTQSFNVLVDLIADEIRDALSWSLLERR